MVVLFCIAPYSHANSLADANRQHPYGHRLLYRRAVLAAAGAGASRICCIVLDGFSYAFTVHRHCLPDGDSVMGLQELQGSGNFHELD